MRDEILIIEEDSSAHDLLRQLLVQQQFAVITVPTANAAVAYLRTSAAPAIIFLPTGTPTETRSHILDYVGTHLPDTDILFFEDGSQAQAAMSTRRQADVDPLVALPCDEHTLSKRVQHVLKNQEQRRLLRAVTTSSPGRTHAISSWEDAPTIAPSGPSPSARATSPPPSQPGVITISSTNQSGAGAASPNLRVLLVEDNADTQWATSELLMALGHQVECATTAEEAFEKLKQGRFDVMCSDISLPGMPGNELAEAVNQAYPDIAIVFASGYGFSAAVDRQKLRAEVLPKPYTMAALQAALCRAVALRQGNRE